MRRLYKERHKFITLFEVKHKRKRFSGYSQCFIQCLQLYFLIDLYILYFSNVGHIMIFLYIAQLWIDSIFYKGGIQERETLIRDRR